MNSSIYGYLKVFHAIAQQGSIAGAARVLQIASPSVSQSLKLLERHIGLPLFNRSTRKMELTEAGVNLQAKTAPLIQSLEQAVENVHDLAEVPSGLVRITLSRFAYQLILQPHYLEFCQRYPEIQLEISIFDGTVDIVQEGFDLGIRFGDKVEENRVARKLLPRVKEGLYVSPAYVEQFGVPTTPEDLKQHRLIGYRFITSNRLDPLILDDNGQTLTVEMPTPIIVNDTDVMADAVRKGIGIGRIFERNHRLLADHQTNFIPILEDYWVRYPDVYLYYVPHSQKAKRVQVLIEFLLEKCKQAVR